MQIVCGSLTLLGSGAFTAMKIGPIEGEPFNLAAKWLILPAAVLLFAVINVAARRAPKPGNPRDIIEGGKTDPALQLPINFLSNTLEQLMLHVICQMGLAATLPKEWLVLIPVLSCWWTAGRVLFYWGYSK